jgi:uncharacterized membrane protein YhiD involved in acid resistance
VPDWLADAFNTDADLNIGVLVERQVLAFILGCVVAGIYWLTHVPRDGSKPDRSRSGVEQPITMMATLVLLTVLIGMIGLVVGTSVARAFSLVGALSIVRFRTVVEDTRDTAFVIFAVAVGMAIGAGYLKVPLVGIPFVALAALVFRPRGKRSAEPTAAGGGETWNATVRLGTAFNDEARLTDLFERHASSTDLNEIATSRQGAAVDRTYRVRLRAAGSVNALLESLNAVPGVQQVELKRDA